MAKIVKRTVGLYFLLSVIYLISPTLQADSYFIYGQKSIEKLLEGYSKEEVELIKKDYKTIKDISLRNKEIPSQRQPIYLGTAGPPGASKSTILETYLTVDDAYSNVVYIDPDLQALRFMVNTYLSLSFSHYAISQSDSYAQVQKNSYLYWRAGSNYIARSIFEVAYNKKYDIAHGTTSTHPRIVDMYQKLKKNNYKIILILCYCEDENRYKAIGYQKTIQRFYQVTVTDAIEKGKMFPQRFPVYLEYADELILHWVDDFKKDSIIAAKISGNKMTIYNQEAYNKFVDKYQRDAVASANQLQSWDELTNHLDILSL